MPDTFKLPGLGVFEFFATLGTDLISVALSRTFFSVVGWNQKLAFHEFLAAWIGGDGHQGLAEAFIVRGVDGVDDW